MFRAIPVREIGDPKRGVDIAPKNTDSIVDFHDLSEEDKKGAIDTAVECGEICIIAIRNTGEEERFVTVVGSNNELDYHKYAENQARGRSFGPIPRYALFNAKECSPNHLTWRSKHIYVYARNAYDGSCWFRYWFLFASGEIG